MAVSTLSSAASPFYFKPIGAMAQNAKNFAVQLMALLRYKKDVDNFTNLKWKEYIDMIKIQIEQNPGSVDRLPVLFQPFDHHLIRLKDHGEFRNDYIFVSLFFIV